MRRRLAFLTIGACCALAVPQPAPAAPARAPRLVRLTATPALFPAYAPQIHDYVVRCDPAVPVRISTWAAAGTTPLIGGKAAHTATVALGPGKAVTVEGRAGSRATAYTIRCLPNDFPAFTETRTGSTPDWYVTTPTLSIEGTTSHYVAIFDGNGVPVWWYRSDETPIDAKILPGPYVAFSTFRGASPAYQVRRLDGTLVRRITAADGQIDDHELLRLPNGDYVFLVYQPKRGVDLTGYGGPADATVLEAEIEEVTPSGKPVWSWTTDGHVDLSESARWLKSILGAPVPIGGGEKAYDFFHANAVSVSGDLVLLSLRHTDGVYAIDRTTGNVLWKLGGTKTPQSLTVLDDPLASAPLGGQHDVRLLPDGTITIFDDGTFLGRAPRAVHYRIDPAAHTATLIGQLADPEVTSSICCGSARLLPDSHWLVSWGGDPVVAEYQADGTPVFRITFDGLFSYRAVAVPRGDLSAAELRAGMDAMASG